VRRLGVKIRASARFSGFALASVASISPAARSSRKCEEGGSVKMRGPPAAKIFDAFSCSLSFPAPSS
jgi:hypothetical protein